MPKPDRKIGFADCFDKKRQQQVMRDIVHALLQEGLVNEHGEENFEFFKACFTALDFIDHPTRDLFDKLMAYGEFPANAREAYHWAQLKALFKKRADLDLGIDKSQVALDTFYQSEKKCRLTNKLLRSNDDPRAGDRAALIHKMQRKISLVLGDLPSPDHLDFGFGPGVSVGCSKNTSVRHKLNSDVTTTEGAGRYLLTSTSTFHAWVGLSKPVLVSGSKWTSVPKTSLTDRGINVEPTLNSFLQKGLGAAIRQRLKRVGVDLNDQTHNQRLALLGSRDGSLATIDLSMASDTVAYNLVMDLLPWDWFVALDAVRSPMCQMPDGTWTILEKFSSMGNGATFELESLIFYALLYAVCCDESDVTISVYGDDLICPSKYYDRVLDALDLLGFIPNSSKSFGSGPFRESCGKDYWAGIDIRPVFIKDELSMKEIYRLHNYFVRTGWLSSLVPELLRYIPKSERLYGPDGYGDGHLIWSEAPVPRKDKRGWEPFYVIKTWQAKPRMVQQPLSSDYGAFLFLRKQSCSPDEAFKPLQTVHASLQGLSPEEWRLPYGSCGYVFEQAERSDRPRYHKKNIRVPVAL